MQGPAFRPDDIKQTIRQGLADRGTPLEFRAARALAKAALVVCHGRSGIFRDRAGSKVREIAHLAQLDFLAEDQNVVFLGPPGTG